MINNGKENIVLKNFEKFLRAEEKSAGTIEKYVRDAALFLRWKSETIKAGEITKDVSASWKQYLVDSGRAMTTVNSMIAATNAFLKFEGKENCCIKYIRVQKRFFRGDEKELTKEEYEKLIKTAIKKGNRKLALLMETICSTGIRVSEVRYITKQAVQDGKAEIVSKGKRRVILLPHKLCRKLSKYAKSNHLEKEIFVSSRGKPLNRRQIWSEMKALCEAAGIPREKVFPHNLRHLFARCFYQIAEDIVGLANVLGHSSLETTRIYLISTEAEYNKKIAQLKLVL